MEASTTGPAKADDGLPISCIGNLTTGNGIYNKCSSPDNTELGGLPLVYHGDIWTPAVVQRISILSFIMILTLCGNIIIITVLTCSKYKKLNSRVNIFIVNLAIGDLTVCAFTMTTEILFVVFEQAWVLGATLCKTLLYAQIVTLASTTFILTAMSFDRYTAICKPLSLGATSSKARRSIVISWLLAFVFASPQLLIFKQVAVGVYPNGDIKYKCRSKGYTAWWQRKLYFTFMTVYILIIPALLISYCYINVVRVVWQQGKDKGSDGVALRRSCADKRAIPRAKVKTIKMTLSIIFSFIACWTPYFIVHLIHIWSEYKYEIPETMYVIAETAALLNSALNPILYGCFNIKMKRGLFEVFCPNRLAEKPKFTSVPVYHNSQSGSQMKYQSRNNGGNANEATKRPGHNMSLRTETTAVSHFAGSCSVSDTSSSDSSGIVGAYDSESSCQYNQKLHDKDSKNGYRYRIRFNKRNGKELGTMEENEECITP